MQKIYGISVKDRQKLKIPLRVKIVGKLTKKTFFFDQKMFFCFFWEILKFQNRIFLLFFVFHQKQFFLSVKCAIVFRK